MTASLFDPIVSFDVNVCILTLKSLQEGVREPKSTVTIATITKEHFLEIWVVFCKNIHQAFVSSGYVYLS